MGFFKKLDVNYFVTFFFLMLTANANILSSSIVAWLIILPIMVIISLTRKQFTMADLQRIAIFGVGYLAFVTFRFFVINDLELDYYTSDIIFLFKTVFLAFMLTVLLKDKALAYIVRVMTHLTIVSFVFYIFQLLAMDTMYKIFASMNFPTGNDIPGYTNMLLFTYTKGFHDYSNSGFVWEPGSFGCFLVLTLMFHFFLNKFRFDATAIILVIGNITTFSTTNYLGLLVLLFLFYRYRVPKINLWVVILIPACVLLVIFIPFLGNKIIDTYEEDMRDLNHLRVLEKFYRHNRMQIPLNRFSSMWHIYETFGDKLILGVSNKYNDLLNKMYTVNISNGVFDFFAKFGVVGMIFLVYRYIVFCRPYVLRKENLIYCVGIILATSFGEPILTLPIILIFIFLQNPQLPFKEARKGLPEMG